MNWPWTKAEPMEKRLDLIEHKLILLEQEWTNVLDQISRHFARARKRQRDEMREEGGGVPAENPTAAGPVGEPTSREIRSQLRKIYLGRNNAVRQ